MGVRVTELCMVGLLCVSCAFGDLNEGLVAYYPFNGNANDESVNGRDGVVSGATLTEDHLGKINSAYQFDGIDDYMRFPQAIPDMTEMTLWMWLNIPSGQNGLYNIFVDADGESIAGVKFTYAGDYHVYIESWKSGRRLKPNVYVGEKMTDRWVNIAWVMTGDFSDVYVDGIKKARVDIGGSNVGGHKMFLGRQWLSNGPFGYAMKGKIADVRIYNRELSGTEIRALYVASHDSGDRSTSDPETNSDDPEVRGSVLYVDDDAISDPSPSDSGVSDPEEDGTEDHPYDAIQEAIEVAIDGQTIVVQHGTYFETIDFLGKNIHVTGFYPDVASTQEQPWPVIDGRYQETVVTFANGENFNAQLSGFCLTRGQGDRAGGILCWESDPVISNCLIVGNRAQSLFGGGGVYCVGSNAVFEHCTISGNSTGLVGGGFYSVNSTNLISNSILWDNSPGDIGLPMFTEAMPPLLVYSNSRSMIHGPGNMTQHPMFTAPGYWALASNPDVQVDGANPQAIWMDGDYHLTKESPCIDAGDPETMGAANPLDLDGQSRRGNNRTDMGSDEYYPTN
jgi:hypothetical protein